MELHHSSAPRRPHDLRQECDDAGVKGYAIYDIDGKALVPQQFV